MEKLNETFNELDPETPQMIAFQEKINEIVDFINFLASTEPESAKLLAQFNQSRIK